MAERRIQAQVCYAAAAGAVCRAVTLAPGSTLERAILASGILAHCPEIDLTRNPVGVYARRQPLHALVQPGDRIEIYEPVNPAAARAARLKKEST